MEISLSSHVKYGRKMSVLDEEATYKESGRMLDERNNALADIVVETEK